MGNKGLKDPDLCSSAHVLTSLIFQTLQLKGLITEDYISRHLVISREDYSPLPGAL